MEQPALWLSTTYLMVRLTAALWAGQLASIILTRGQANIGRSMAMAILSMPLAIQAWRVTSPTVQSTSIGPLTPSMLSLIAAILSAVMLIDCLRRWLSSTDRSGSSESAKAEVTAGPQQAFSMSSLMLSICGLLVTLLAIVADKPVLVSGGSSVQRLALGQNLSWIVMTGVTIATTLELTLGKTGPALARQAWRTISLVALLALVCQMVLSLVIVFRLRASEAIEDAVMPVLFAIGLAVVGYIVWAIPNRTATHAGKPPFRDHISLALSGWIALLCLLLAATLPTEWPWKV